MRDSFSLGESNQIKFPLQILYNRSSFSFFFSSTAAPFPNSFSRTPRLVFLPKKHKSSSVLLDPCSLTDDILQFQIPMQMWLSFCIWHIFHWLVWNKKKSTKNITNHVHIGLQISSTPKRKWVLKLLFMEACHCQGPSCLWTLSFKSMDPCQISLFIKKYFKYYIHTASASDCNQSRLNCFNCNWLILHIFALEENLVIKHISRLLSKKIAYDKIGV